MTEEPRRRPPPKTGGHRFQEKLRAMARAIEAREADREWQRAQWTTAMPTTTALMTPLQLSLAYRNDGGVVARQWRAMRPRTQLRPSQRQSMAGMLAAERNPYNGARGGILADEAGTGKTLMTIAHVFEELQDRVINEGGDRFGRPTLIVVPKQLLSQWVGQIELHLPPGALTYYVAASSGPTHRRAAGIVLEADVHHLRFCIDVVLTTYETLRRAMTVAMAEEAMGGEEEDIEEEEEEEPSDERAAAIAQRLAAVDASHPARNRGLFGVEWYRIVADEAVYIKNTSSRNYAAIQWLRAERRLFLTATPAPNARVSELNALLRSLGCRDLLPETAAAAMDDALEERRATLIKRFFISTPLPPEERRPPLRPSTEWLSLAEESPAEDEGYAAAAEFAEERVRTGRWKRIDAINYLRQACLSPLFAIVDDKATYEAQMAISTRRTPVKMAFVIAYAQQRLHPHEKLIVYSEWVRPLEELAFHLRRAGISRVLMHGNMSESDADAAYTAFCAEDDDPRVMLMTSIGAVGKDALKRANHILELAPTWSPGLDEQLGGRINRLGQTRPERLFFLKLVLRDTIEEHVNSVNWDKGENQGQLLLVRPRR